MSSTVNGVAAVAATRDFTKARAWYTRIIGRAPDLEPTDGVAEWQMTDSGWLQLIADPVRAPASRRSASASPTWPPRSTSWLTPASRRANPSSSPTWSPSWISPIRTATKSPPTSAKSSTTPSRKQNSGSLDQHAGQRIGLDRTERLERLIVCRAALFGGVFLNAYPHVGAGEALVARVGGPLAGERIDDKPRCGSAGPYAAKSPRLSGRSTGSCSWRRSSSWRHPLRHRPRRRESSPRTSALTARRKRREQAGSTGGTELAFVTWSLRWCRSRRECPCVHIKNLVAQRNYHVEVEVSSDQAPDLGKGFEL
jgi:hypothetical protein